MSSVDARPVHELSERVDYLVYGVGDKKKQHLADGTDRMAVMFCSTGSPDDFVARGEALAEKYGRTVQGHSIIQSFERVEMDVTDSEDLQRVNDMGFALAQQLDTLDGIETDVLVITHADADGGCNYDGGCAHNHIVRLNHDNVTGRGIRKGRTWASVKKANDALMREHGLRTVDDRRAEIMAEAMERELETVGAEHEVAAGLRASRRTTQSEYWAQQRAAEAGVVFDGADTFEARLYDAVTSVMIDPDTSGDPALLDALSKIHVDGAPDDKRDGIQMIVDPETGGTTFRMWDKDRGRISRRKASKLSAMLTTEGRQQFFSDKAAEAEQQAAEAAKEAAAQQHEVISRPSPEVIDLAYAIGDLYDASALTAMRDADPKTLADAEALNAEHTRDEVVAMWRERHGLDPVTGLELTPEPVSGMEQPGVEQGDSVDTDAPRDPNEAWVDYAEEQDAATAADNDDGISGQEPAEENSNGGEPDMSSTSTENETPDPEPTYVTDEQGNRISSDEVIEVDDKGKPRLTEEQIAALFPVHADDDEEHWFRSFLPKQGFTRAQITKLYNGWVARRQVAKLQTRRPPRKDADQTKTSKLLLKFASTFPNDDIVDAALHSLVRWVAKRIDRAAERSDERAKQHEIELLEQQKLEAQRNGEDPERFRGRFFGDPDCFLGDDEDRFGRSHGDEVDFKRTWGSHIFTVEECEALLAGEQIEFEGVSKKGDPIVYVGRLREQRTQDGEGRYFGFDLDESYNPQTQYRGVWRDTGAPVIISRKVGDVMMDDGHCAWLLSDAGWPIQTTYTRDGKTGDPVWVQGELVATDKGPRFQGTKRMETEFRGHEFTRGEVMKAFAGEQVVIECEDKRGRRCLVVGEYGESEYEGRDGKVRTRKGFQPDDSTSPLEVAMAGREPRRAWLKDGELGQRREYVLLCGAPDADGNRPVDVQIRGGQPKGGCSLTSEPLMYTRDQVATLGKAAGDGVLFGADGSLVIGVSAEAKSSLKGDRIDIESAQAGESVPGDILERQLAAERRHAEDTKREHDRKIEAAKAAEVETDRNADRDLGLGD